MENSGKNLFSRPGNEITSKEWRKDEKEGDTGPLKNNCEALECNVIQFARLPGLEDTIELGIFSANKNSIQPHKLTVQQQHSEEWRRAASQLQPVKMLNRLLLWFGLFTTTAMVSHLSPSPSP